MYMNKVVKNATWIIGCKIIQSLLGLVVTMLTTRYLGPSDFGLINYASSVVAFVTPIMQLGLPSILVQEYIQHPKEEGKIFGSAIILSLCSSVACMIGVVSFATLANGGDQVAIIVCGLYSIVLVFQAMDLIQYWFQAKYLSKYSSIVSICAYIFISIYKFFLLATKKNIYWFAISNALDYCVISIALLVIYKKIGGLKLKFSLGVSKRLLSLSRYYIISNLMITLFAQMDKVMLSLMLDNAATGYYSAAVACASMTSFVFSAIIDSARPSIFESKRDGYEKAFESKISRLYCIIIYLSLAQCLFMTILAKPIIMILYGEAYYHSISALQIIVWYTTFAYLGSVRNIWILAAGKQKYLWIINLSGAVINFILNAILIPLYGVNGAALASLITQIFTNVIIGFCIKPIRRNNYLMLKGLNLKFLSGFLPFKKKLK